MWRPACVFGFIAALTLGSAASADEQADRIIGTIDLCLTGGDALAVMTEGQSRHFPPFLEAPDVRPAAPDLFMGGGRSNLPQAGAPAAFTVQTVVSHRAGEPSMRMTRCGVSAAAGLYGQIEQHLGLIVGLPVLYNDRHLWTALLTNGHLSPASPETRNASLTAALRSLVNGQRLVTVALTGDAISATYEVRTYEALD